MSFLTTALATIFVFGLVILIHEAGHFFTAKYSGIKVNEFAFGMGPAIFKHQKGETLYRINLLPIGGYVSMEGETEDSDDSRSFNRAPISNRFLVMIAGVFMNFVLGFVLLLILVLGQDKITSRTVSSFYEGATTYETGLRVGDTILSVNGRRCYIADDIVYEFARTQNGTADFVVERDGEQVQLNGVTFETKETQDGLLQLVIDFTVLPTDKTFQSVLSEAANWSISLARVIFLSLTDLLTGNVAMNQLSGPVGIVSVIGEAAAIGFDSLLLIAAMLSINLGVFNLLPLPALDGGRVILLGLEAVRKRPLDPKYEAVINTVGFLAMMLLMVFVTFNDIGRLFS